MIRKTLLVISLVLLAATVGLWVRSYRVSESLLWGNRYGMVRREFLGLTVWFTVVNLTR